MQNENASASLASISEVHELTELSLATRRLPPFVTATLPQNPTHLRFWAVLAVDRRRAADALVTNRAGPPACGKQQARRSTKMANPAFSKHTIVVEHVTIQSSNAFDIVRAKLEALLPRIDDGVFTLLRYGESARALRELEAGPTLSIFGFRDHGALLTIAGLRRRAIQYDIGNPLTASRMTRYEISAGLYAPVRVLLRADSDGVVVFEYDRPASVFGQFENDQVDVVAQRLDQDLQSALEAAAS